MPNQCCADDTQMHCVFKMQVDWSFPAKSIEACLSDIKAWMNCNYLQLNDSKTELIVFGSKRSLSCFGEPSLVCGSSSIHPSTTIRDLGVFFDNSISMALQVWHVVKSWMFHSRNIRRIRKHLIEKACKTLDLLRCIAPWLWQLPALRNLGSPLKPPSTLSKCSSQVYQPEAQIRPSHINPVLSGLHWLPIAFGIKFKLLLLTYKVLHGTAPEYLSDIVRRYIPLRSLQYESKIMLAGPVPRISTFGECLFFVSTASL